MKFSLENTRSIQIHSYQPGALSIKLAAGNTGQPRQLEVYRHSLILSAMDSLTDWPVSSADELELHHFELAWQSRPAIVLYGSGQKLVFPAPEIRQEFALRGIGFEAMNTSAACRTYNVLAAEGREVMACLIID